MARLWLSGFELQTSTVGMEWTTTTNGTLAIETSIKHSGNAALRVNTNAAAENIIHLFRSTQGAYWVRTYFYIVAAPAGTRNFFGLLNSANLKLAVRMTSGRVLQFYNEEDVVQVGSDSSAISLNTWYRLEMKMDDTTLSSTVVEARLYAASDEETLLWNPSGTIDITASGNRLRVGMPQADASFDGIFDDVAINDSSGSYCNSWCGEENLIILRPDGDSGSPQWTRGGTDSGANWSQVEETPPDDVTTYVESATLDQVDEYTLEATPAAIQSGDTIIGVWPSSRFAISNTSGADPDFVIGLKYGSDFDETANLSGAGEATYNSHQVASPRNYPPLGNNSNYEVPGTSSSYTKTILDSLIFRLRETFTDTHTVRVSAVWVYVGYKPGTEEAAATRKFHRASVLGV